MKKILAMLLAAVMLIGACSAFAEENGKTMVQYDEKLSLAFAVPEGYTFDVESENGFIVGLMMDKNEETPNFSVVIAPDEEHDELPRLNDLNAEEKQAYINALTEDLADVTYEVKTTGYGTEVIVIDDQTAEYDIVTLTTLYYGCIVTIYVGHDDGHTVSEEDIAAAMQLMTDLDFVVAE